MAVTQNSYIGNGSTTTYSFTFPYLKASDVKASIDAVDTTAFTLPTATTIQFNTAPSNGAKIKIFRETATDNLTATFYAGSAIKSEDLNENFTQNLYSTQEVNARYLSNLGGTMIGNFGLGEDADIVFEGATDNANETTITVADPTADRTITFPDTTGTVVTTGDTGTVTSTMLADGTIVAADLASNSVTTAKIQDDSVTTQKIAADAVVGSRIADDQINSEHYVAGSIDTEHIANSQITNAKMADNSVNTAELVDDAVTAAKLASNSVVSASIVDGSIATADIADNAITNAKMADDSVGAAELVDTSVGTAALASNAVTNAKMADASVGTSELVNDAVTTVKIANNAVTTAKITDSNVTTAKINNDAVTSAKIADNAIGNEHLQDDSVRTAEIQASAVTTAKILNNAVTADKLADNAVDRAAIVNDAVNEDKIADIAVRTEHIANSAVTDSKIASNAVTTDKIADAELTTLAGMQSGTASVLASSTALTATTTELNQLDGKTIQTTVADNDAQLPTSGAIVDYVAAQIAPLGGLEVIATEVAFPNTQPASGVVISISDAGGIVVNGSGVSTTGRTVGGSTVTINGFPSSVQSSTLAASMGLMVSSTGSSQTYTYHKLLGKESDITALSDDINDFNNRYRVSSSAPTSSLDNGDLWFDTANGKMMVYNGTSTAWEEVSAVGSFNINTLSSSGNTGGGSATFNGTAYRFTLSNPPQDAQQLLVSINGVVQKPNSGSSQPSEGFAISGNDIIFSAAPASGSISFIVTLGQSVQIGTPSDNTISTAKIQNLAVTGDKIATNLDLADNKKIRFGTGNDLEIFHDGTNSGIQNTGGGLYITTASTGIFLRKGSSEELARFNVDGAAELYYDNAKKLETTSTGISVSGSVAADGLAVGDAELATFGSSADLVISHGGIDSTITNNTGQLKIAGDAIRITNAAVSETQALFTANGAVELYYDNSKKLETYSGGVNIYGRVAPNEFQISDNEKAYFGTGLDLEIYHDGTNSIVNHTLGSGALRIQANDVRIMNNAGNEHYFVGFANDYAGLYFDNSQKFKTLSTGAKVIGQLNFDDGSSTANTNGIGLGSSQDCRIFHDGSSFQVRNTTGPVTFITPSHFQISADSSNDTMFKAIQDGAVELYHDNTKRLETQSGGVRIRDRLGVNCDPNSSHPMQVDHDQQYIIAIRNTAADSSNFPWLCHKEINSKQAFAIHINGISGDPFHVDQDGAIYLNKETSAANALDDYEEGTFTPVSPSLTLSYSSGHYTKIGRYVVASIRVGIPSNSNGNNFVLDGLPFNSRSYSGTYHNGGYLMYSGGSSYGDAAQVLVYDNSDRLQMYNKSGGNILLTHLDNVQLRIQVHYFTA